MDPLTALAVSGNILQFVQFVGGLLNNTRKLYASASGITTQHEHAEDICEKLINFSESFEHPHSDSSEEFNSRKSKHVQAIVDCAAVCKEDYKDLLEIMMQLKVKGGKGPRC